MNLLELTAEQIISDSTFEELFSEFEVIEREKLALLLADRAKVLGVKGKFDKLYIANKTKYKDIQKKQIQEKAQALAIQRREQRQVAMTNFCADKYPDLLCGAWECDESGVRTFGMFGELIACYHPIMPVKRLINLETHKEKMVIAFKKGNGWRENVFDKSTILSASKIINAMTDFGVLLSSENAKYLVRYFAEIEALNIGAIPTEKSTSKMGWINGSSQFMPYVDEKITFDSESSFQSLYDSISHKGNKDKYIEFLKRLKQSKRKEPIMCIVASLASVLVKPCGTLPFIFHLYGEAGKGKTISLMLASSIWGDPGENGYMADPKSTKTAFEMRLNLLNNLPFICDDMAQLKKFITSQKNGDFSDFIYLVCSGKGNERSNINLGLNTITTWKNSTITSGEKPITSEISNGGELLRVVEYQTAAGDIFHNSKGTADFLRKNYGFIGREFVETIQKIGFQKVNDIYLDFIERITAMDIENEKEGKQVNSIALMLTADKILSDYILHDSTYLDIAECFKLIKSNKQMSDNERALEFICNEIQMHKKKFMVLDNEPEQRWGYFDGDYTLINPNSFSGMAERGNFNKKMFIEWAVTKDFAEVNKGRIDKRLPKFGGSFICLNTKNIERQKTNEVDKQPELKGSVTVIDVNDPIYQTDLPF